MKTNGNICVTFLVIVFASSVMSIYPDGMIHPSLRSWFQNQRPTRRTSVPKPQTPTASTQYQRYPIENLIQLLSQGQRQNVHQGPLQGGQGFGFGQRQGFSLGQGQGLGFRQGQGLGFNQGQGQGFGLNQGQGQGFGLNPNQGQGFGLNPIQGQGFGFNPNQGQGFGQGLGLNPSQGQGLRLNQGQGQIRQGQGVGRSQGKGSGISQRKASSISQGKASGISQGKASSSSQGSKVGLRSGTRRGTGRSGSRSRSSSNNRSMFSRFMMMRRAMQPRRFYVGQVVRPFGMFPGGTVISADGSDATVIDKYGMEHSFDSGRLAG